MLGGMNCNQTVTKNPQSAVPSIRLDKYEINARLGHVNTDVKGHPVLFVPTFLFFSALF
jgi:hypothetical protein